MVLPSVRQGPNNPAGYRIIKDPNILTLLLQDTWTTFWNWHRPSSGGIRNILHPAPVRFIPNRRYLVSTLLSWISPWDILYLAESRGTSFFWKTLTLYGAQRPITLEWHRYSRIYSALCVKPAPAQKLHWLYNLRTCPGSGPGWLPIILSCTGSGPGWLPIILSCTGSGPCLLFVTKSCTGSCSCWMLIWLFVPGLDPAGFHWLYLEPGPVRLTPTWSDTS